MEGTVKWFNRKKGYGFITGEDNQEYFVHHTAIAQGTFIRDNDKVSFEPAETERGKQAQNIQLIQKASERPKEEFSQPEEDQGSEQMQDSDEEIEQQFDD